MTGPHTFLQQDARHLEGLQAEGGVTGVGQGQQGLPTPSTRSWVCAGTSGPLDQALGTSGSSMSPPVTARQERGTGK
jgi:hypothetical protein